MVREPAVAGQFYPGNADELKEMIKKLKAANQQLEQKKLKTMFMEDTSKFVELDEGITDSHESNIRYKLYQDHFKKLSYNCQKLF